MAHRFLISFKKWPMAIQKAFSDLELDKDPLSGETRIVDFQIGPPQGGELPLRIFLDGRRALLCQLGDTSPSFLHDMREWMERCLVFDQEGHFHPEVLTLNCTGLVLSLTLIHVGWDEIAQRNTPISYLVVICSDREEPALCCFCDALETISGLYHALINCILRYRPRFDSGTDWYDVKRFDMLNPVRTSDRMLESILSSRIERITSSYHITALKKVTL